MQRNTAQPLKNSFRTLFLFCGIVLVLILGSLTIKVVQSIKGSIYDPSHNFIIGVRSPKEFTFFGIDSKEKAISVFRVHTDGSEVSPGRDLGIPTDAVVSTNSPNEIHLKSFLPYLLLHGGKITWFDIARLMVVTNSMSEDENSVDATYHAHSPFTTTPDTLFNDPHIVDEGVSVGIVNATGQVGYGARLERILTVLGTNVVSVTTAQQSSDTSQILTINDTSYTLKRIASLLHFPTHLTSDQGVSDILIIVGKDSLSTTVF